MFDEFVRRVRETKNLGLLPNIRLLALDPGETTGWSIWSTEQQKVYLHERGQSHTWPIEQAVDELSRLLGKLAHPRLPVVVVHEAYNVYAHRLQQHTWSSVPTLRVIGTIETLCAQNHLSVLSQTAQVAKAFCTDSNLKTWGFYEPSMRHARDSIRHGIYCILYTDFEAIYNAVGGNS